MSERPDWVQIKDPKSQEIVYVNVKDGDYRSNLPPNTLFKSFEESQWWQLYDDVSSCYYYYNTLSQQTVWKKPRNVDIIPLYKVQQFNKLKSKDWKLFLNEKLEESRKANKVSTSFSEKWHIFPNSKKYSFKSSNHLEACNPQIKCSSIWTEPLDNNRPYYLSKSLKSSASDDESLDAITPHDYCGLSNVGYSTLHTFGMKSSSRRNYQIDSSVISPKKTSGGNNNISRSFDQVNIESQDKWANAVITGRANQNAAHLNSQHLAVSQKPHQGFPRTNPHLTMQRSSSSFRSNKNSTNSQELQFNPVMHPAQSTSDCYRDSSSTLTRPSEPARKVHLIDNDQSFSKSFFQFAGSFNFISRSNPTQEQSVKLLSFKTNSPQNDATLTRKMNPADASRGVHPTSSQSSLMTSSVMSTSMKSCDTDDFTSVADQTSSYSAVTRATDECDNSSVFSSSSTPPPLRAFSLPMGHQKAVEADVGGVSLLRKTPRGTAAENSSSVNNVSKGGNRTDQRPLGFCYSESDAQWEEDVPKRINSTPCKYSHLTAFAQFAIKELSMTSFNDHRKRFLGKHLPISCLLTWTKDGIRKPILRTSNRIVNREAPDILKRIQLYMGDRSLKRFQPSSPSGQPYSAPSRDSDVVSAKVDQSVLTVIVKGWMMVDMRDEIYMQLCKQTNGNPNLDSTRRGWELLCICLSFFPPVRLSNCLKQRLNETSTVLAHCNNPKLLSCLKQFSRRLETALASGAKKGLCKPTPQEFEVSRESIYTPPLFGSLLNEVMEVQKEKFPQRQLPWILTSLAEAVLRLNGTIMEGIFRIPGDIDEVNRLKAELCEKWTLPPEPLRFDASVPASLLKLWLRQLYEPLIPYNLYNDCLIAANDQDAPLAIEIVSSRLPSDNRLVLAYVIRFLQVFAAQPVSCKTKMDANNLAMVMAPNLLRSHITDPRLLLDQAKKEMSFVRMLILNWDTSFMENII